MSDPLADPLSDRAREIDAMLSCCEEWPQRMSKWEQDRVSEWRDLFDLRGTLSQGQREKLEEIYARLP